MPGLPLPESPLAFVCAVLLGMAAGYYAWRVGQRYGAGLRAGQVPDAALMLKALGLGTTNHTVVPPERWRAVLAGVCLAAAYGWLCCQPLSAGPGMALMLLLWMLLVLACIDLQCSLLPDALTLPLLACGIATAVMGFGQVSALASLFAAAIAYAVLLGLGYLFRRWRGREGLGGGDIKCMAAIAAWSGLQGLFLILVVASLFGLGYALLRGRSGLSASYPFGPCLLLASTVWLVLVIR